MSENNEEIDDYAAQDLEIMNTMEATKHFCSKCLTSHTEFDLSVKQSTIFLCKNSTTNFTIMGVTHQVAHTPHLWQSV